MGMEDLQKGKLFLNNSLQLWFLEKATLDYTSFSLFIVNQSVKRNMSSAEKICVFRNEGVNWVI